MKYFETKFKRPKIREDSSDFDDFWTELIAMVWAIASNFLCVGGPPSPKILKISKIFTDHVLIVIFSTASYPKCFRCPTIFECLNISGITNIVEPLDQVGEILLKDLLLDAGTITPKMLQSACHLMIRLPFDVKRLQRHTK